MYKFLNTILQHLNEPNAFEDNKKQSSQMNVDFILIDCSGSMGDDDYAPSRLQAAISSAKGFAESLHNKNSSLGIGKFNHNAKVIIPPSVIDLAKINRELDRLHPGGGTNIAGAIKLAGATVKPFVGRSHCRILLLTDGCSTTGNPVRVSSDLKTQGVQLDIVGIGKRANVNEKELRKMASTVGGKNRYWFIDDAEGLYERFQALALRAF